MGEVAWYLITRYDRRSTLVGIPRQFTVTNTNFLILLAAFAKMVNRLENCHGAALALLVGVSYSCYIVDAKTAVG